MIKLLQTTYSIWYPNLMIRCLYSSQRSIICLYFVDMPFYAVVFRTTQSGAVAQDWPSALKWKDTVPNSYAKKFSTKNEAESYLKNMSFEILYDINKFLSGNYNKGIKRKNNEDGLLKYVDDLHQVFLQMESYVMNSPKISESCKKRLKLIGKETLERIKNLVKECEKNDEVPSSKIHKCELENELNNGQNAINITHQPHSSGNDNSDLLKRAKELFKFNSSNEVIVYTDGACSNNGKNQAMAGAGVFFSHNHPLNLSKKVPGNQTNNNAEIYSVILAIDQVKSTGVGKINIHTDSKFVIQCVTEWMPRWKVNGWKTSDKNPVKNKEMLEMLDKKIQLMEIVSWTHVRGHQGIEGNEAADKLARQGAEK
ncbi:uncharacterized protein LOC126908178 [Daktulosphaira vitifoliae]|uniref:uncharacterized protein LOC126908178 n=1 Tax=Daktulosphaira vitifoliae TaxID=58002 RepID=UPI0021AA46AE|nr:uncharacterized protein LOC126908178 [Daktulosphaira vitifoliae]